LSRLNGDRRLIEDYLPIEALSAASGRENVARRGHVKTIHTWWARRPLIACRAAVYSALVPIAQFALGGESDEQIAEGRRRSAEFIQQLCTYPEPWDLISQAQQHILAAHAERLSRELGRFVTADDISAGRAPRPKVLDMFAGGGSIPLEALRLGCDAFALDLNPVAHIIELCTLTYPQRYGKPDLSARGATGPKNNQAEPTWGGLAGELRFWGNWILQRVEPELVKVYPPISSTLFGSDRRGCELTQLGFDSEQPAPGPKQDTRSDSRRALTPIACLWTRTVRCKNPSCGSIVPLLRQTWLCRKKGRFAALKVIAAPGTKAVQFLVVTAPTEAEIGFDPGAFSKGGNAICPFCGTVADSDYVKSEALAKRMGRQMMAVVFVSTGKRGKVYLAGDDVASLIPDEGDLRRRLESMTRATGISLPEERIEANPRSMDIQRYGFEKWSDLFTPRQALALLTIVAEAHNAEEQMRRQGLAEPHVKALCTAVGLVIDKMADYMNVSARWGNDDEGVTSAFSGQSVPMVWDFAEAFPCTGVTGSIQWSSGYVVSVFESIRPSDRPAAVIRGSATSLPWPDQTFDAIVTDPPYYDNYSYSNLSDFFYVWLKRTCGHLHPEHFGSDATPKRNEIIAAAYRHEGVRQSANSFYESMMAQTFREAFRVLKSNGRMVVVYAHKTTLGWSTLVNALRHAGFTVTEAWPLDTEMRGRLVAMETSALASSIFLVARKREGTPIGAYEDARPDLEEIVRERIATLWNMGVSGADLVIAAVGAGLRSFTRYERVEYANGEDVPAERFLAEVEAVVLETLLERIFAVPQTGIAAVDAPSRFYVLWRFTYRAAEVDAGEAIVFTYGQPVELDGPRGLSSGPRPLVEKKKSKYRLRDFSERGDDEKLGIPNDTALTPPLVDVLHRALWLMEHQPAALAQFLDQAKPNVEHLRMIAQALAGPALQGGELRGPRSAEQTALATMLANWRNLIEENLFRHRD
jgi:putative DNA methylase